MRLNNSFVRIRGYVGTGKPISATTTNIFVKLYSNVGYSEYRILSSLFSVFEILPVSELREVELATSFNYEEVTNFNNDYRFDLRSGWWGRWRGGVEVAGG